MTNGVEKYSVRDVVNRALNSAEDGLNVCIVGGSYTTYEGVSVSPGAEAADYDVKTTGGGYATVTTAGTTEIYNNHATLAITVKLNATGNASIRVPALQSRTITEIKTTNLFITTPAAYNAAIDIILYG